MRSYYLETVSGPASFREMGKKRLTPVGIGAMAGHHDPKSNPRPPNPPSPGA